ncbi:MAG: S1C family serine protease [Pirellulaceae bacterium]
MSEAKAYPMPRIYLWMAVAWACLVVPAEGWGQSSAPTANEGIDDAFAPAIARAQQRTVKVYGAEIGRSPGYATGLIVSDHGDILTANGVFLAGQNLRVTLPSGETYPAVLVRRSQELQTALLKIDAATPDYFNLAEFNLAEFNLAEFNLAESDLAEAGPIEKGDWILAVSNAFKVADGAEPLSVNIGVLGLRMKLDARRGLQDFPYAADVLLYDAITSNPGAAGGAVVTAEGKLVGMIGRVIEAKSTNTRLNYAVPIDLLAMFLRNEALAPAVAATSPGAKADLGIRLFALGGRRGPAYIDHVQADGPAAAARLKTDDLIVSLGGQVVRNSGDYSRIVTSLAVGQEVVIEVKRKNELLRLRIVPAAEG